MKPNCGRSWSRYYLSLESVGSKQIDFPQKGVTWALRVSPHYYNTEEEVERMVVV